jgi:AcrR family transcriptional regulator
VTDPRAAGLQATARTTAPTRRDRLRAATTEEIIETARRLLVTRGPDAVSLRAIAREMGMTAPGLYRYFGSHEELIRHVIADIFTELRNAIEEAMRAHQAPDDADPAGLPAHLAAKMVAACRAFRGWALEHTGEFGLIFGVPLPGYPSEHGDNDVAEASAEKFAGTFFGLFVQFWNAVGFPVPGDDAIDPRLKEQLSAHFSKMHQSDLPAGALVTFLRCWTLLHGAVALEVFGHLKFALTDASAMFEYTLGDLARLIGLRYPPEG